MILITVIHFCTTFFTLKGCVKNISAEGILPYQIFNLSYTFQSKVFFKAHTLMDTLIFKLLYIFPDIMCKGSHKIKSSCVVLGMLFHFIAFPIDMIIVTNMFEV